MITNLSTKVNIELIKKVRKISEYSKSKDTTKNWYTLTESEKKKAIPTKFISVGGIEIF